MHDTKSVFNRDISLLLFPFFQGPPSAQKSSSSSVNPNANSPLNSNNPAAGDTSYDLLLYQQQVYLQCQLEWQQKVSDLNNDNLPASGCTVILQGRMFFFPLPLSSFLSCPVSWGLKKGPTNFICLSITKNNANGQFIE